MPTTAKIKTPKVKTALGAVPEKLKGFGGGLPRAMGVKITFASKKKIIAELPVRVTPPPVNEMPPALAEMVWL